MEDFKHWTKFIMTGYIPLALRVRNFKNWRVEVKDGQLIRLILRNGKLTSVRFIYTKYCTHAQHELRVRVP